MQKKISIILLLAVAAVTLMFVQNAEAAAVAPATNGGASATIDQVYCDIRDLTTGNVGTLIGLFFAFAGLLSLLLKGSNAGIFLIIIGISVTAFPGLLNSFIEGMSIASTEAPDITIQACSGGSLPSMRKDTMSGGTTINAITRGTNAPATDNQIWYDCSKAGCAM